MPPPPPPPPPMPPMGRGAGGAPPPPPMLGMKAPGGKPPSGAGRGALLGDITKGARLKKVTQINDRSAPIVGKVSDGPAAAPMGAPAIPGMGKPPAVPGLAPPVPGGGTRARSNSDTGDSGMAAAPQLGGIFAGGMPKLRKSGGVKTGADQDSAPYLSDPESTRASVPKPPRGAAPRPPGAPPSAPPAPPVAALRPHLRNADSRPSSVASTLSGKPKPPPPIGKKPSIPPPSGRKPSGLSSPARAPPVPGSAPPAPPPPPPASTPSAPPPPPPASSPSPRPTGVPPAPPLPPSPAPRAPARSTPPPPPSAPPPASVQDDIDEYDPYKYDSRASSIPAPPPPPNGHAPSLAEQAARNAFRGASPAAPPPPPPASAPPPPNAVPIRQSSMTPLRSMDASSYTLTNGGSGAKSPTSSSAGGGSSRKGHVRPIHDLRWRFQDEAQFPRPREFTNGPKLYRAGRGSSVPLDLSAYD